MKEKIKLQIMKMRDSRTGDYTKLTTRPKGKKKEREDKYTTENEDRKEKPAK